MLSTESLPGPSCSCKSTPAQTDEIAPHDQLPLQEAAADPLALAEIQSPAFSIRDYAFASRSKDISKSWPFPKKLLQVCLKHGIRDLLPPFEPPDIVRSRLCKKDIGFEQSVGSLEAEQNPTLVGVPETEGEHPSDKELESVKYDSCLQIGTSVGNCLDQDQHPSITPGKPGADLVGGDKLIISENGIHSTVTSNDPSEKILENIIEVPRSVHVSRSASEASSELEVADPPLLQENLEITREPAEKKCKLIVKLSALTEANRAEDISSLSSTVSDVMASKVCPVCKTFSSTSNTTLNAHIDQCLSTESNAKQAVTNVPKIKVKPRKKRLMVDIYATASHCTLEDLDRRNGTNWAVEMNLLATNGTAEPTSIEQSNKISMETKKAKVPVAQSNEVSVEAKKPKMSPDDIRDDGDEGTVYVDSNGIKLRILSKVSDTTPLVSRKDFKLKKHTKIMNANGSSLISKNNLFGVNSLKHMKVKPHSKKSSLFKLSKGQIQVSQEADNHVDNHQEGELSEGHLVNASDHVKGSAYANLRQWVCSKRSDLPKKVNNKDIHKSCEIPVVTTRTQVPESSEGDAVDPPVLRSHVMKFSRLSEDLTSFHKTKRMESLFSTEENVASSLKDSSKLPALRSRWTSEGSSSGNNSLLLKLSRSMGNIISSPRSKREEIHSNAVVTSKSSLKVKKSSMLKKKVLIEKPSYLMEAKKVDGSEKYTVPKKTRKHRISFVAGKGGSLSDTNVQVLGSTEDTGIDGLRSNVETRVHSSNISDSVVRCRTKKIMDQSSPSSSKIQESNQEREGMQIELTADVGTECSTEKAAHDSANIVAMIPGRLKPVSNVETEPCSSMKEHVEPICEREILIGPVAPSVLDEQEGMQYGDVNHNQIITQSIQMSGEVKFRGDEDSSRYREEDCHADAVCMKGSNACSTSHGDEDHEIPQENSSVTSTGALSCQDHMAINRKTSPSPVSSASTSFPTSPKDLEAKDLEAAPSNRSTAVRDNLSSSFSNKLVLPSRACIGKAEETSIKIRSQEPVAVPLLQETQQFVDDQPCCCSRKDGFARDPRFSRPSVVPATPIRPSISTSFGSNPSMRSDMLAIPNLDLPSNSSASSDSAAKVPSFIDFSSPNPSPRTQTLLRLMGKNLMVSSEESAQLPASDSVSPLNSRCFSPLGFTSSGGVLNQESFLYNQYHHQIRSQEGVHGPPEVDLCPLPATGRRSAVFGQVPPMSNHQMPQGVFSGDLHTGLRARPNPWAHPKQFSTKVNPPSAYNMQGMAASYQHVENPSSSQTPYMRREVIVIDDSPEHEADPRASLLHPSTTRAPFFPASSAVPQRSFSGFPSQSQYRARETFSGSTTSFPIPYTRTNANSMMGGNTSEGSSSLLPRPYLFSAPSTSHPLYYSQTFR